MRNLRSIQQKYGCGLIEGLMVSSSMLLPLAILSGSLCTVISLNFFPQIQQLLLKTITYASRFITKKKKGRPRAQMKNNIKKKIKQQSRSIIGLHIQ